MHKFGWDYFVNLTQTIDAQNYKNNMILAGTYFEETSNLNSI